MTERLSITACGAIADGKTLNTTAIQSAIDRVAEAGGGTVVVPPGTFLTGTIVLKNRITLQLEPGSVLKGSPDIDDYLPHPIASNPFNNPDLQPYHLILADGASDVSIIGTGTLDGSGPAFWDPPSTCEFFTRKEKRPSAMMEFHNCHRLRLQNIVIHDSPGWTVHLQECTTVHISGVEVSNNLLGPNTDAIDVTDSRDVRITECKIVAGDDAIVLKSLGGTCERVSVANCVLQTRCSALKLGAQESVGVIRHVTFSDCIVHDSSRGIHLACVGGGTFSDIIATGIILDTHNDLALVNPIHLDCSVEPVIADKVSPGLIERVRIENILVRSDSRIILTAGGGARMRDIFLRGIHLEYPVVEDEFEWASRAVSRQFSPCSPEARAAQAAVVADGVENLSLQDITMDWPKDNKVPMHAIWARNIKGGFIDCPMATASGSQGRRFHLENSEIKVRD